MSNLKKVVEVFVAFPEQDIDRVYIIYIFSFLVLILIRPQPIVRTWFSTGTKKQPFNLAQDKAVQNYTENPPTSSFAKGRD
ncbi:hypothetical protein MYX76_08105 [Desulfobacterota bacterium AH_259_B03_O07]|nr:hypothetical protein [Desulfobacterota bacterium AH_259_B03_O07]